MLSEDILAIFPILESKNMMAQWVIKNNSDKNWQPNPYKLYLTMLEPQETSVWIKDFQYDPLNSQEELKLRLHLDFNQYKFDDPEQNPSKPHYVTMMLRIVDVENNFIMGDAKDDHMLLFIKFEKEKKKASVLDGSTPMDSNATDEALDSPWMMAQASMLVD